MSLFNDGDVSVYPVCQVAVGTGELSVQLMPAAVALVCFDSVDTAVYR